MSRDLPSDVEIAEAAELWPIGRVAEEQLGVPDEALIPYGRHMAKLDRSWLATLEGAPPGRLVLVTAISPTPAGEGKTTTVVGLTDGLRHIGVRAAAALREPSMGPVFGMKGGAAGGGYAQVVPMTDINLHFTGDFAAIAAANNLLAALVDNHVHHGNALGIDPRAVTWKRVVDMNDRALRQVVVGLGGTGNGFPREDGWDIVVASELMAIFCLATSLADLKERIGRIVVGHTRDKVPVTAADLEAQDALTILLANALQPNLVQTLEHSPVFVHGGPFANIAHGCNSVLATRTALALNDVVVTEAGFGADLGAEKFFDLKCRLSGLRPSAVVVVATVKALKYHGGVAVADVKREDVAAVRAGGANLRRHLQNLREVFGVPGRGGDQPVPPRHRRRGGGGPRDRGGRGVPGVRLDPRGRRRRRARPSSRTACRPCSRRTRSTSASATPTTSGSSRRRRRSPGGSTAPTGCRGAAGRASSSTGSSPTASASCRSASPRRSTPSRPTRQPSGRPRGTWSTSARSGSAPARASSCWSRAT